MPSHYVKTGVAGVILRGKQIVTDMAFEADRKIIERLKTTQGNIADQLGV